MLSSSQVQRAGVALIKLGVCVPSVPSAFQLRLASSLIIRDGQAQTRPRLPLQVRAISVGVSHAFSDLPSHIMLTVCLWMACRPTIVSTKWMGHELGRTAGLGSRDGTPYASR